MSTVQTERQQQSELPQETRPLVARFGRRQSSFVFPTVALVIGLVITIVLTWLAQAVFLRNQRHLLRLRVHDAAGLVVAAIPSVQTPLAAAAELGDATRGNPAKFREFASTYVGPGRQFLSLSLWRLSDPTRGPVAYVGAAPKLAAETQVVPAFFARVAKSPTISLLGLLGGSNPRLGYGYSTPGLAGGYAVYAEAALPRSRRSPLGSSNAFAGLGYSIYLNQSKPADLLVTSARHLPLPGTVSTVRVPFGDSAFVLSLATQHSLAGSLPQDLPWIIAIGGLVLSLAAAAGAMRLTQGRLAAERLAGELEVVARENRELYREQRTIALTLQHALLPDRLPEVPGVHTGGRYEAGEQTVDIGGDWYDVVRLDDGGLLLVIGDVSGRGLKAATTMAALRYAIHAYAAQDDPPAVILSKLAGLISVARDGQLATILCARVDVGERRMELASAGHLPALMLSGGEAHYIHAPIGMPVGVDSDATYQTVSVSLPPGATVLAFTDGLVEKRGEHLDQGLERLRRAAIRLNVALPELLSNLVTELSMDDASDDIAIVGLQWTS